MSKKEGYVNYRRIAKEFNNLRDGGNKSSVSRNMIQEQVLKTQWDLFDNLEKLNNLEKMPGWDHLNDLEKKFQKIIMEILVENDGRCIIELRELKSGIKQLNYYNKNLEGLDFPKIDENGEKYERENRPGQITINFNIDGKINIVIRPYDHYYELDYKYFDVNHEELKKYLKGFDAILNLKTPDEAFGEHGFEEKSHIASDDMLVFYENLGK